MSLDWKLTIRRFENCNLQNLLRLHVSCQLTCLGFVFFFVMQVIEHILNFKCFF